MAQAEGAEALPEVAEVTSGADAEVHGARPGGSLPPYERHAQHLVSMARSSGTKLRPQQLQWCERTLLRWVSQHQGGVDEECINSLILQLAEAGRIASVAAWLRQASEMGLLLDPWARAVGTAVEAALRERQGRAGEDSRSPQRRQSDEGFAASAALTGLRAQPEQGASGSEEWASGASEWEADPEEWKRELRHERRGVERSTDALSAETDEGHRAKYVHRNRSRAWSSAQGDAAQVPLRPVRCWRSARAPEAAFRTASESSTRVGPDARARREPPRARALARSREAQARPRSEGEARGQGSATRQVSGASPGSASEAPGALAAGGGPPVPAAWRAPVWR
eukprot:CAMPEP_0176294648 /NCGR_PEP_ID=MMETSP0121_2-20121125/57248_1 /TAXON_ID=160619 /ORGANISM="Kryptoperidinium foliaceum, Strain CCMP 1326" /LENGTH=339 /DNA_ID=CAMNT_0017635679 /DNA_START=1 /DNA_END=1017 /DNA_ORIENTATION=-